MSEKLEALSDVQGSSATVLAATGMVATQNDAALLLPDLQPLAPADLHVVGSRFNNALRLKFGTTIRNAGPGHLETRRAENPETGNLEVYQFVYTDSEEGLAQQGRQVGTFNYEHRHEHLHLEAFARYELWSVDVEGNLLEPVAPNHKVGFCLMDNKLVDSRIADLERSAVCGGCRADIQGISVGYGDEYVAQLYEQDINVSRVPDGNYALTTTANPDLAIEETN